MNPNLRVVLIAAVVVVGMELVDTKVYSWKSALA